MGSMGLSYQKGSRRRSYGMMLLMAFGTALISAMFIHKLRERRIFNLLLNDKDSHLLSLHLLLQKEKELNNEMKRKMEDVKSNINTIRTHEMELHGRVMEMQSTIGSLRDELKSMEYSLKEKHNEIKLLRERELEWEKESQQWIDLTKKLKQKEAEIEYMKNRLKVPVKVWSVSTDDPSKQTVNFTDTENIAMENEITVENEQDSVQSHESNNFKAGENSTTKDAHDSIEAAANASKREDTTENRGVTGDQIQKQESSQDEISNTGGIDVEKHTDEVQIKENEDSQHVESVLEPKLKEVEESHVKTMTDKEGEVQESHVGSKVGMKLEKADNSRLVSGTRVRARHGNSRRTKMKTWKILLKNRKLEKNINSENNGGAKLGSGRFFGSALQNGIYKTQAEQQQGETETVVEEHKKADDEETMVRKGALKSEVNRELSSIDSRGQSHEDLQTDTNIKYPIEDEGVMLEKFNGSLDVEMMRSEKFKSDVSNSSNEVKIENLDEHDREFQVVEGNIIPHNINNGEIKKLNHATQKVKMADEHGIPEGVEVAESRESEAADRDFYGESNSNLEDEEEFKEETDESEF